MVVAFAAHGTKQLRTPDRGCYQRNNAPAASASQQQQHQQAAGPHGLSPAGQHSSSSNRPAPPAADSAAPGSTSYMQQQAAAAGSGSSFASSSSNTSSSTNVSSSTLAQMGRHGFPAAVGLAAGDGAAWQHADAGLATGGSTGAGLSHLVQSLVAQMTSSQQEAAESSRAAAEAQQKLQLLQQVLGRNLNACTPSGQTFAGAAPVAGGYGGTMPPTYEWQPTAALAAAAVARRQFNRPPMMQHNMPLQLQLQQQQHPQHGSGLDALYPRRHSVDETLLRRARNAAVGPGRPVGFGTPGASPVQQPAWAALPGGGVSRSGSGSASADIEALAAAFAGLHGAAGLPPADYGGLPPAGLVSDSVLLSPAAATGSQQLPGGGGHWQSPVQGVDATSMSGGALLPMGALCNIPQLNPPGSSQAVMHTNASLSAPQLQSDYLLQLHAMLQANAPVAGAVPAGSVRASFDMGATYLPAMSGGLVVRPFDLPGTDEATTATGNSRASHNCSVDTASVMVVVPDKLSGNLIGGANDMGWF